MTFILNEKKYAENILNGDGYGENNLYTTNVMAKYYKYLGYNQREIRVALKRLISERRPDISERTVKFWIKKSLKLAETHSLCELDEIIITDTEIGRIKKIHSEKFKDSRVQRLAFTLLCLAKFSRTRGIKDYWINVDYKHIFRLADLKGITIDEQCLMIHELYAIGYIDLNPKIESHSIKVLGVADGKKEIVVKDINESGLIYEEYCGGKVAVCQKCGKIVKYSTNKKIYCQQCAINENRKKTKKKMREIRLIP